eukprot:459244-Alexandrium_andersonii.AAC.1
MAPVIASVLRLPTRDVRVGYKQYALQPLPSVARASCQQCSSRPFGSARAHRIGPSVFHPSLELRT